MVKPGKSPILCKHNEVLTARVDHQLVCSYESLESEVISPQQKPHQVVVQVVPLRAGDSDTGFRPSFLKQVRA